MEEIILKKTEWSALEYKHEEKSIDFFWALGLISVVFCIVAIWYQNYLFGVFILVAGGSLFLFTIRHPKEIMYSIETSGLTMGKDKYMWKDVVGFHIKKEENTGFLLIKIKKYLLPVYTIPLPFDLIPEVRESLTKVTPNIELEESRAVKFMEKIGF